MLDPLPIITQFDITPTAAKTYIALLKRKKASIYQLAQDIGTYKANVGEAMHKLLEKGLATTYREEGKKVYLPTNPEKLFDLVEEKQQTATQHYQNLKQDLTTILPTLLSDYQTNQQKELFEIYRGKKAYIRMINEILKEQPKNWQGYGNLQIQAYFPIQFKHWFKNIHIQLFSNKTKTTEERLKEAKKTTKIDIHWLPQELDMSVVWTLFGNNLLILIYEPDIIAIRIRSTTVIKTFKNQFSYQWKKK
ncbi:MAG: helix-turn-helix domain-containing protein [Nanoarchaeota archaeon]|nr:helix-turn-helix domain-containing protein [Nanoarchaeota archaeon]